MALTHRKHSVLSMIIQLLHKIPAFHGKMEESLQDGAHHKQESMRRLIHCAQRLIRCAPKTLTFKLAGYGELADSTPCMKYLKELLTAPAGPVEPGISYLAGYVYQFHQRAKIKFAGKALLAQVILLHVQGHWEGSLTMSLSSWVVLLLAVSETVGHEKGTQSAMS